MRSVGDMGRSAMRLHLTIPPKTSELRAVRRIVEGWAGAHDAAADSLCVIATELLANAISVSPADEDIVLTLGLHDEEVALTVADAGPAGFHGSDIRSVGPESRRGRGLHIVSSLSNRLTVERIDGRTVITAYQYRRMLGPVPDHGTATAELAPDDGRRPTEVDHRRPRG